MTDDSSFMHPTNQGTARTCSSSPTPISDEKFTCQECSREFVKKSKLNRHVREHHMNIKEQVCPECGKNFKRNSHLKRHMISHSTNPKPHKCDFEGCYMAFTCKHHLDRHIRIIHYEDYINQCPLCLMKFPKKISLAKHLTYDHGKSKPISCEKCNKTFFSSALLSSHACQPEKKPAEITLPKPIPEETPEDQHTQQPSQQPVKLTDSENSAEIITQNTAPPAPSRKRRAPFQPIYEENKNFTLSGNSKDANQNQLNEVEEQQLPLESSPSPSSSSKKQQLESEQQAEVDEVYEPAEPEKEEQEQNPSEMGSEIAIFRSRTRRDSQQGSYSMRFSSRRLSELFQLHDIKERKNSFNSDIGNLTIFKELLIADHSDISRKTSVHVNPRRKVSLFNLQKLEDGFEGESNQLFNDHQFHQINDLINDPALALEIAAQSSNNPLDNHGINNQSIIFASSNNNILQSFTIEKAEEVKPLLKAEIEQQNQIPEQYENQDDDFAENDEAEKLLNASSLQQITNKKTGEKCYKCNYQGCNKFYTKLSNLKTHIRTFHFKSKDFSCTHTGCKSAYLHKKSLKEHIARVHNIGINVSRPQNIPPLLQHQQPITIHKSPTLDFFYKKQLQTQPLKIITPSDLSLTDTNPPPSQSSEYFSLHENELALSLFASTSNIQSDSQQNKINYHKEFRQLQMKQQEQFSQVITEPQQTHQIYPQQQQNPNNSSTTYPPQYVNQQQHRQHPQLHQPSNQQQQQQQQPYPIQHQNHHQHLHSQEYSEFNHQSIAANENPMNPYLNSLSIRSTQENLSLSLTPTSSTSSIIPTSSQGYLNSYSQIHRNMSDHQQQQHHQHQHQQQHLQRHQLHPHQLSQQQQPLQQQQQRQHSATSKSVYIS